MCGNNPVRFTYVVQIEIEALYLYIEREKKNGIAFKPKGILHGLLWVTPSNYTKLIIEKDSKVLIGLLNSGNDSLANFFHQNLFF